MGSQETCSCERHKFRYVFAGNCYIYGWIGSESTKENFNLTRKITTCCAGANYLELGVTRQSLFVCKITAVLNNYQAES